jgi:hypothetical protein
VKLRLFVASSVEGLDVAYAVQENLEYDFEVTVWPQGVFALSKSALDTLEVEAGRFDAAVFVFSPDDTSIVRGSSKPAVRDNVLFELGLFIGRLGRDKCFLFKPRSFEDVHFPTDLLGVTPATYDDTRQDNNIVAALGPACNKARRNLIPRLELQKPVTNSSEMEQILLSRPFRLVYNPPKYSKRIVFAQGGQIVEGNNKNEHSWRLVRNKLELVQLDGHIHSRFAYVPDEGVFRHTNDPDTRSIRNQYIVPDLPEKREPGV